MREIAYRAWDKVSKRMIYGPSDFQSWLGPQMTFDGHIYAADPTEVGLLGMVAYKHLDWVLMQSTGLTDISHQAIFEGDILGGQYEGGKIAYCETCKAFQYHACDLCFACEGDLHWYELVEDDGKLEVIGNIYENPKLLVENQK